MASAASFPHLAPPNLEDSMEVSSPTGQNFDDDIDIDYDDYSGGFELVEDERMLEDGEHPRPGTANDEVMSDDHDTALHVAEEVMQDGPDSLLPTVDEDDELIDYDEELQDPEQIPVITAAAHVTEQPFGVISISENAGNDFTAGSGDSFTVLEVGQTHVNEVSHDLEPSGNPEVATELPKLATYEPPEDEEEAVAVEPVTEPAEATSSSAGPLPSDAPVEQGNEGTTSLESAPDQVETEAADPGDVADGVASTDTGLHPMMIRFGDLELPLFSSHSQPDGLLSDDNLASVSLAELLQNCKQHLASQTGEGISDSQDMVLGFDHLGLLLVEDSRSAFETSLNDVLEVYLHLHQNDETQDVPPLCLTVSVQLKFSSNLGMLREAADQGRGIASFSYLQAAENFEEEVDDYYEEEVEDEVDTEAKQNSDADADAYEDENDGSNPHAAVPKETAAPELTDGQAHEHHGGDESHANEDTAVDAGTHSAIYEVSNENDDVADGVPTNDGIARDVGSATIKAADGLGKNVMSANTQSEDAHGALEELDEVDFEIPGEVEENQDHDEAALDAELGSEAAPAQSVPQQLQAQSATSSTTLQGDSDFQESGDLEQTETEAFKEGSAQLDAATEFVEADDQLANSDPNDAPVEFDSIGASARNEETSGEAAPVEAAATNVQPGEAFEDEAFLLQDGGSEFYEEDAGYDNGDLLTNTDLIDNDEGNSWIADEEERLDIVHELLDNFDEADASEEENVNTDDHAEVPEQSAAQQFDDDDDLGFDEDLNEDQANSLGPTEPKPSALGKRSYDSRADEAETTEQEPELKMARSQ